MGQIISISMGVTGGEEQAGRWAEWGLPWVVSVLLHSGIGLLALMAAYVAAQAVLPEASEGVIVPTVPLTEHENDGPERLFKKTGLGVDLSRDAAQMDPNIGEIDGWAPLAGKTQVLSFLEGDNQTTLADTISRGLGGGVGGPGKDGTGWGLSTGVPAPFGTPNGGGPGGRIFTTRTRDLAQMKRVVYVLDHSGSMLDNFSYLQEEVARSVEGLLQIQQFAVVVFSEDVQVLGPGALMRATPENKRAAVGRMNQVVAKGQNDAMLAPFQEALAKAFAMKPQVIYFLTDGQFDERLLKTVSEEMNKDHAVQIHTIAFVNERGDYIEQLRTLAKRNRGTFKFVAQKELGR